MSKVKNRIKKRKEEIHNIFSGRKPIHKRIALWIILIILFIDILLRFVIFK